MTASIISTTSIVQLREEVLGSEVDGDFIVLGVERGKIFGFNKVGNRLWSKLTEPVAVSDLCDDLAQYYRGDLAIIRRDVIQFLQELEEGGFLAVR
jgi:hypothetical protein